MEIIIITLLLAIAAETTYLAVKTRHKQIASSRHEIVLDTSVLIDGRITEIIRSGLVSSTIIVPSFVVDELQFMADKADHDKRERARYGLDVIEQLQRHTTDGQVIILSTKQSTREVDSSLVELCRSRGSYLSTIDYNLNKVATVHGVRVVNINELAHAIRSVYLPDEELAVEIKQPGQNSQQGVGYLDDGTMVVVESARQFMGKSVRVRVQRALQTAAGRMVFAVPVQDRTQKQQPKAQPPRQHQSKQQSRQQPPTTSRSSVPQQRARRQNRKQTPEDTLIRTINEE